jgi:hypothetical protein
VAGLANTDDISAVYAGRVLDRAGIPFDIRGSLGHSLRAACVREEAERPLRRSGAPRSPLRGEDASGEALLRSSVVPVNASVEDALRAHAADTDVGRILRRAGRWPPSASRGCSSESSRADAESVPEGIERTRLLLLAALALVEVAVVLGVAAHD